MIMFAYVLFVGWVAAAAACADSNAACTEWAAFGECDRNPAFMNENCCASCTRPSERSAIIMVDEKGGVSAREEEEEEQGSTSSASDDDDEEEEAIASWGTNDLRPISLPTIRQKQERLLEIMKNNKAAERFAEDERGRRPGQPYHESPHEHAPAEPSTCDVLLCLSPGLMAQTAEEAQCRAYAAKGGPCTWDERSQECWVDLAASPEVEACAESSGFNEFMRKERKNVADAPSEMNDGPWRFLDFLVPPKYFLETFTLSSAADEDHDHNDGGKENKETSFDFARDRMLEDIEDSVDCRSRPEQQETAFVYIGAAVDVFALHFLKCGESRIFFIDPLTYFRNLARVNEYLKKHPNMYAKNVSKELFTEFDHLFECKDCAPALQRASLDEFASDFRRRLLGAMKVRDHGRSAIGGNAKAVLADIRTEAHFVDEGVSTVDLRFTAAGVARHLTYVVAPGEDVDYPALLGDVPVSTLVCVGTKKAHVASLWRHLCGRPAAAATTTVLRTMSDQDDDASCTGPHHRRDVDVAAAMCNGRFRRRTRPVSLDHVLGGEAWDELTFTSSSSHDDRTKDNIARARTWDDGVFADAAAVEERRSYGPPGPVARAFAVGGDGMRVLVGQGAAWRHGFDAAPCTPNCVPTVDGGRAFDDKVCCLTAAASDRMLRAFEASHSALLREAFGVGSCRFRSFGSAVAYRTTTGGTKEAARVGFEKWHYDSGNYEEERDQHCDWRPERAEEEISVISYPPHQEGTWREEWGAATEFAAVACGKQGNKPLKAAVSVLPRANKTIVWHGKLFHRAAPLTAAGANAPPARRATAMQLICKRILDQQAHCEIHLCLTPGAETQTNDAAQCEAHAAAGGQCAWNSAHRECQADFTTPEAVACAEAFGLSDELNNRN